VQQALPVSERRACQVLGQSRGTQRYVIRPDDEEQQLVARLHELVGEHPRYGYRFMTAILRREGWRVNRKRVYRLWRQEGFQVPRKQRKKRRLGSSAGGCLRRRAEHKDHVWAWDFVFDRTANGRSIKWLSIVDESTRECLALEVDRNMTSEDVLDVLRDLFVIRGVPKHIRSDNGPEFIAHAIRRFLAAAGVETLYVEPGSPWQNGYAESFHSRLRSELLDAEVFENVTAAQALSAAWRNDYNHYRPHSSLGYNTPAEFAARAAFASAPAAPPPPQTRLGREQETLPITQPVLS
jgi:transposase InsO family protein